MAETARAEDAPLLPWPEMMTAALARQYVGIPAESSFFKAVRLGSLPKPVNVPGAGQRWRKADLDAAIRQLTHRRTGRGRRPRGEVGNAAS